MFNAVITCYNYTIIQLTVQTYYLHNKIAEKHKERSGSSTQGTPHVFAGEQKKTAAHMLKRSQLAQHCSMDDLITFNDVGKQCLELWKKMV